MKRVTKKVVNITYILKTNILILLGFNICKNIMLNPFLKTCSGFLNIVYLQWVTKAKN